MKKLLVMTVIALTLIGFGVLVSAEQGKQNHHCQMPDGKIDKTKTHKQCTAAKGKWVKDADAARTAKKKK